MNLDFPIAITKMSGAGNDFIVIDHRRPLVPEPLQPQFAQLVCRRRFSVGADGLILIEDDEELDFRWRFYNSDGSVAEMCGNGARCAARFAFRRGIAGRNQRFRTVAGVIEAEVIGEQEHVSVRMTEPFGYRDGIFVNLDGTSYEVFFINTGVPHAVVFVASDQIPVREWGRQLRFHEQFAPAGTNVDFVRVDGDGALLVRTYERGVEDETMACGTGVVAAALVAVRQGLCESPVDVTTGGGEQLLVQFTGEGGEQSRDVYLQGAARIVYEGALSPEALL
ncbi:MAG: diaminopimelate epimerase [Desulfofustis sp.]|jgi:diaminopimelate epimerase|nr:diaminopimelate epimerase [Desulfofustis sp.]